MIRYAVAKHMARKGWTNAYQLAHGAGLTEPVAARVIEGEPLERIQVATAEALARAFRVKPWAVLEWIPDE